MITIAIHLLAIGIGYKGMMLIREYLEQRSAKD